MVNLEGNLSAVSLGQDGGSVTSSPVGQPACGFCPNYTDSTSSQIYNRAPDIKVQHSLVLVTFLCLLFWAWRSVDFSAYEKTPGKLCEHSGERVNVLSDWRIWSNSCLIQQTACFTRCEDIPVGIHYLC